MVTIFPLGGSNPVDGIKAEGIGIRKTVAAKKISSAELIINISTVEINAYFPLSVL
jgi:hypothetical protein